jgi:hypothetical protein
MLDFHVARAADDQGLAMTRGHHADPFGLDGPTLAPQVFQRADMVHFDGIV